MEAAAASLPRAALDLFNRVLELGNNYYIQNAAWRDLQIQVSDGLDLVKAWDVAAANRGLSDYAPLVKALDRAKCRLEKEEANKKKTKVGLVWKTTLLPRKVELRVQEVVKCLAGISQTLRMLQEVPETFDKTVTNRQPFFQTIPSDSRYVHFSDTEAAITEAVEKDDGCPVVFLHGGAGTGKSTVVRKVTRCFEEKKGSSFEEVVYKDCGLEDKVDYIEFLIQLIQRLGETVVVDFQTDNQQRNIPLERQVKTLLSARTWLFILDNLTDEEFLLNIVNLSNIRSGGNVKFLVASQEYGLCGSIDPVRHLKIPIQELDEGTAREILASHAGFADHQIPCHLLGIANEMIAQTDGLPLALTTLGGAIASIAENDESVRNDPGQWYFLYEDMLEALKQDKCPNALFQQPKYRRSLWSTLELTIEEKLSIGCRNLLFVAHSFAKSSFPEAVIRLLFCPLRGVQGDFESLKVELTRRNLITRKTELTDGVTRWYLHSLQNLYINSEMDISRASVIKLLIGNEGIVASGGMKDFGDSLLIHLTLCALYLQKPLAEKAAAQLYVAVFGENSAAMEFAEFGRYFIGHPCDYCEEIICLIARPFTDQWTRHDRFWAQQTLICHIYWRRRISKVSMKMRNKTMMMVNMKARMERKVLQRIFNWLPWTNYDKLLQKSYDDNYWLPWTNYDRLLQKNYDEYCHCNDEIFKEKWNGKNSMENQKIDNYIVSNLRLLAMKQKEKVMDGDKVIRLIKIKFREKSIQSDMYITYLS